MQDRVQISKLPSQRPASSTECRMSERIFFHALGSRSSSVRNCLKYSVLSPMKVAYSRASGLWFMMVELLVSFGVTNS